MILTEEQIRVVADETMASAAELRAALLTVERPFTAADLLGAVIAFQEAVPRARGWFRGSAMGPRG
jgi:hypothetical protein